MGAYELDAILKKWERGELTAEQAIGQVLQLLQELAERVGQLERKIVGERPSGRKQPPGKKG